MLPHPFRAGVLFVKIILAQAASDSLNADRIAYMNEVARKIALTIRFIRIAVFEADFAAFA